MKWYSLSDVPPAVRTTMETTWARWDAKDLTLDGTLSLVHDEPLAAQQAGTVSRALANRYRVPQLCQIVHQQHGLTMRSVWCAVGLYLGLHPSHVARLFYGVKK